MNGRCRNCNGRLVTVRAGALYCSTRCRVAGNRRKNRQLDAFPTEMTSKARFVRRSRKKVPLTVEGRSASSTNPSTWASFGAVKASAVGAGLGFVLGDGVGCIDLDDSIVDGVVVSWAREVLDANPGTFVEVSQSGTGLHVFGFLEEGRGRVIRDGRNIEVYSVGRYIALTGERFEDAPSRLEPLVLPA